MVEDYLSTEQAANLLGYSRQHIRILIRSGRLEGDRIGKSWVVPVLAAQA